MLVSLTSKHETELDENEYAYFFRLEMEKIGERKHAKKPGDLEPSQDNGRSQYNKSNPAKRHLWLQQRT